MNVTLILHSSFAPPEKGAASVRNISLISPKKLCSRTYFIRKFKFDELPQLLNVIIGKMSLVGPRPETTEYTKLYSEEEMVIFSVRPGITDEASIVFADLGSILSGGDPDHLYFEKVWGPKMELRMKYVREQSFLGDIKLIFRTLAAPFSGGAKDE